MNIYPLFILYSLLITIGYNWSLRNVAFYMRAAASFLRGTEDKKPVKAW